MRKEHIKNKSRGSATNASTLSNISADWLGELLLHELCLLLPHRVSPALLTTDYHGSTASRTELECPMTILPQAEQKSNEFARERTTPRN